MALSAGVKVEGLAAFRRGLKEIDEDLPRQLRRDLLDIAEDIARQTASRIPSRSGSAKGSIRAGVSGNTAYVQGGKASVPYYGWLDFGSRKPVKGRPRSVGPWKGSGSGPKRGRYLYPTVDRNKDEIIRRAKEAFEKTAQSAFNTSGSKHLL